MRHTFKKNGSHYNGGNIFFGHGFSAVDEPRLSMVRKFYKRRDMRGKVEDSYYVDGEKAGTYEDAVTALKTPPTFTPEEVEALAKIGDEAADLRHEIGWQVRWSLHAKGAIEYGPPGHFKRTDAGRKALAQ